MVTFHPADAPGPRVVIVGGSICGLACCHALQRAGCSVVIFEKAKGVTEAGAGLGLDAEACEALCSWGLEDKLMRASLPMPIEENRAVGGVLKTLVRDQSYDHRSVHWADIHHMLLDSLHPKTAVNFGCKVTGFEELRDGKAVQVFVEGNADVSEVEADVMVAADGSMSQSRQKFNREDKPLYRGYCAWRGVLYGEDHKELVTRLRKAYPDLGRALYFDIAEKEHCVLYELPKERINWLWYVIRPPPELPGGSVTVPHPSEEEIQKMHKIAEEKWVPEMAELMKATEKPFINAIYDRDPLPTLIHNHVVLVGEAAHPTTPHGLRSTNMSISDAKCLEECFKKYGKDIEAALQEFDKKRQPITAREVLFSRFLGQLKQSLLLPKGLRSWLEADPQTANKFLPQRLRYVFDPCMYCLVAKPEEDDFDRQKGA